MEKLINWAELSRLLTKGNRGAVRANNIPLKHRAKIKRLIKLLEAWYKWAEQ